MFDIVPEAQRDSARSALATAFGEGGVSGLHAVSGGASGALTYRVEARSRQYMLRLETTRGAMRNPHQYTCMRIAADAGVAPPLVLADDAAGVAIMDFVPAQPLDAYPGGPVALAGAAGALIARLQACAAFPPMLPYLDVLARMLEFVRSSGAFAPGLLDRHAEGFARIREAYVWDDASLVAAHNDPNANNLLFDGERLWLIDWETAYRNDPLTDLAIVIENLAPTPELENAAVIGWRGRPLDAYTGARLVLMRQLTRLYYAGLILSLTAGARSGTPPECDLSASTADEFRAAVMEGRLAMGSPDMLFQLGKMQLARFLDGLGTAEFEPSLAIAGAG